MAHSCPECWARCHCGGDIDDLPDEIEDPDIDAPVEDENNGNLMDDPIEVFFPVAVNEYEWIKERFPKNYTLFAGKSGELNVYAVFPTVFTRSGGGLEFPKTGGVM